MNNFNQAYQQLNSEQKQAVDTIEGPVMVIAGPGTGKTQTIALRIANILRLTDADPDSILALTFTDSGARAMRERLVKLIGTPAYYLQIYTFHSFCHQIIRDYPDFFYFNLNSEPLSDLEKIDLIHQILDKADFRVVKPSKNPYYYTKALLSSISTLKREGISISKFNQYLQLETQFFNSEEAKELTKTKFNQRHKTFLKHQDLLFIYQQYQQYLQTVKRFDFDDLINLVIQTLQQQSDLLYQLQERYHYFLVDEYQDTNSAQNQLLTLLTSYWGKQANIMVVGDPDQSIMRFQGASLQNQFSFLQTYPQAKVITLTHNYRSTQTILNSAFKLISHNQLRLNNLISITDNALVSHRQSTQPIHVAELNHGSVELVFLVEQIRSQLKQGTSPNEIAIIYRNNNEVNALVEIFNRYQLNYSIRGGLNLLEDFHLLHFIKLLEVVYQIKQAQISDDLFTILNYPNFKLNPLDVLRLARFAGKHRLTLFEVISNSDVLSSIKLSSPQSITQWLKLFLSFIKFEANHTFSQFFEYILNESGYLDWILTQPDSGQRLTKINTLFNRIKQENYLDHQLNLDKFFNKLKLIQQHKLRLNQPNLANSKNSITLTTAHSAKGLEWDYVYIIHFTDKKWGNNSTKTLIHLPTSLVTNLDLAHQDKNEEERRLFYVALTRARQLVTITYAKQYTDAKQTKNTLPSMFLSELIKSDIHRLDTSNFNKNINLHLKNLLTSPPTKISVLEKDLLQPLIDNFVLSPTSLNNYLQCPYKFKLTNLLQVPRAKSPHLVFGTVIHSALEQFYRQLNQTKKTPSLNFLLQKFTHALDQEILTLPDYQSRLDYGYQVLTTYYNFFKSDFKPALYLEKNLYAVWKDIKLKGKLDRIDLLSPKSNSLKVIDYKTGTPKRRNQVEGKTKDSSEDLKRQLTFYQLLLSLDPKFKHYNLTNLELDFIEKPFKDNKSGKLQFTPSSQDITQLQTTIIQVISHIRQLDFPRTQDFSHCQNCSFKHHCFPNGIPSLKL